MKAPTPVPRRSVVCVFELVNLSRREVFVGVAPALPSESLAALHPKLAHWEPAERVELRLIEERLPPKDAGVFVSGYADSIARAGWKPITE